MKRKRTRKKPIRKRRSPAKKVTSRKTTRTTERVTPERIKRAYQLTKDPQYIKLVGQSRAIMQRKRLEAYMKAAGIKK
jgi:hypothetical protein